jgi:hypothetical protein
MPPLISDYAAVPYEVAHSIYGALLHTYMMQTMGSEAAANTNGIGVSNPLVTERVTLAPHEIYFVRAP